MILITEPVLPEILPPKALVKSETNLHHVTSTKFTKKGTVSLKIDIPGVGNITTLSGPETKVLTAILQATNQRGSKKRIALFSGYAVKGGAFGNTIGKLRSSGLITYEGDQLVATDDGIRAIPDYEPLPTDTKGIINFWTNKLGNSKGKILAAVFEYSPISREALADNTGYSASGGAFGNNLGALRTLGLIEYLPEKMIGISKELMPVLA